MPSDFLCRELPRAAAILTNFPRKFVPDVRFLRDQPGTEETARAAERGKRERERKEKGGRERERETEALRKSWASIPGQASRGGLKLLTRLSNSVEEEERRWPGRNRVSGDVSLPPLFPSASVSLGNQSYFMTFSFHGRKTSSPSPRRREKPF